MVPTVIICQRRCSDLFQAQESKKAHLDLAMEVVGCLRAVVFLEEVQATAVKESVAGGLRAPLGPTRIRALADRNAIKTKP